MGMAASQARLLTLTARLHDVEYEAQSIQQAKLQLATQQDDAYAQYLKALDATSLTYTVMSGNQSSLVVANFSNLFSLNGANTSGHNYALIDSRGRVVVSEDVYNGYTEFMDGGAHDYTPNAQTFALFMMYGSDFTNHTGSEFSNELVQAIFEKINNNITGDEPLDTQLVTLLEQAGITIGTGGISMDALVGIFEGGDDENRSAFLNYFFGHYGNQMFNEMEMPNEDVSEFNYYVRMFNAIQQHGGCISIEDFDGPQGNAATNSEWLTAMIQSGEMTIEIFSDDNQHLSGTSVADDTVLSYTTTTQIDRVAMAKAEAEYEHELKMIDRKDKKFDMDLSKLETERSALTKQYDSLKKVVDDNIERTFGIFS